MTELLQIAPPPSKPVGSCSPEQWHQLETELGIRFPEDYKQFIGTYGDGRFADFVGIPHPFHSAPKSGTYASFVRLRLEGIRWFQREAPKHAAQFPVYPQTEGLFPVGYTDNGGTIFWLMQGPPDSWPVVCFPRSYTKDFEVLKLALTVVLGRWLNRTLKIRALTPPDLFPLPSPTFVSSLP
jgi:hypothetical protein